MMEIKYDEAIGGNYLSCNINTAALLLISTYLFGRKHISTKINSLFLL